MKRLNNLGFIFFLISSIQLFGQIQPLNLALLEFTMQAGTQSSGLPSAFSNAFIFPDFIDAELKDNSEKRLSTQNRLGGELSYGLRFYAIDSAKLHDGKWMFGGSVHNKRFLGVSFQRDLFRSIFYGNSQFAGDLMQIGPLSFTSVQWMQIGVNMFRKKGNHEFHLGLHFLKGRNLAQFRFTDASLLTDPDDASINVSYNGQIIQTSMNELTSFNTFSPGLSLSARWDYSPSEKKHWTFSIEDVGFLSWNTRTQLYTIDTTFRFEGIAIENILTLNEELNINGDSLISRLQGSKTLNREVQILPLHAFAALRLNHTLRSSSQISLQYRYISAYLPLLRYQLNYLLYPNLQLGISLGYGGFGRFNSGASIAYTAFERHKIVLSTFANEGMIAPTRFSGNGLGLNYVWLF